SACVDGRYAPIGLFGLALIPKYASSMPLVHGVAENKVAVAATVPVIAKLAGLASLSGTSTSMVKLPVAGPGEVVKPKFTGGLMVVGEFVPLSMHRSLHSSRAVYLRNLPWAPTQRVRLHRPMPTTTMRVSYDPPIWKLTLVNGTPVALAG